MDKGFQGTSKPCRATRQGIRQQGRYEGLWGTSSPHTSNCNCRYPCHKVFTPASPSLFRPRNPPSLAIARTASPSVNVRRGFCVTASRFKAATAVAEKTTEGTGRGLPRLDTSCTRGAWCCRATKLALPLPDNLLTKFRRILLTHRVYALSLGCIAYPMRSLLSCFL